MIDVKVCKVDDTVKDLKKRENFRVAKFF